MKWLISLLPVVLLVAQTTTAEAQNFNSQAFYQDITGTALLKDGTEQQVTFLYHPALVANMDYQLFPLANLQSGNGLKKTDIDGLLVDGHLWLPKTVAGKNQLVVVSQQGGIEKFTVITNNNQETFLNIVERVMGDPDLVPVETAEYMVHQDGTSVAAAELLLSFRRVMADLVSDYAELSTKVADKEPGYRLMNMDKIISEYNAWYAEQYPGKVKVVAMGKATDADAAEAAEPTEEQLEEGRKMTEALRAMQETGRPTEPSPEIASRAPNIPVKKEDMAERIARIKADGNAIGVNFVHSEVEVKKIETSAFGSDAGVRDSDPPIPQLADMGQKLVNALNDHYGTDIFELIDLEQIPQTEATVMGTTAKIDDWWATKYKVVIDVRPTSYYEFVKTADGKLSASFATFINVMAMEYPNEGKEFETDYLIRMFNMGSYMKTMGVSDDTNVHSIEAVAQLTSPIDYQEVADDLASQWDKKFEKLLKKLD